MNSLCGEEALSCGCLSYMLNCPELLSRTMQLAVYIDQINHKSPSPQLKLNVFLKQSRDCVSRIVFLQWIPYFLRKYTLPELLVCLFMVRFQETL